MAYLVSVACLLESPYGRSRPSLNRATDTPTGMALFGLGVRPPKTCVGGRPAGRVNRSETETPTGEGGKWYSTESAKAALNQYFGRARGADVGNPLFWDMRLRSDPETSLRMGIRPIAKIARRGSSAMDA